MDRLSKREERERQLWRLSFDAFEKHSIIKRGERADAHGNRWPWWYCRRLDSGMYGFEAVILMHSRLLVHGDIETVVFDGINEANAISFIDGCQIDYLVTKTREGRGGAMEVDNEVYLDDLRRLMAEPGHSGKALEMIQQAIDDAADPHGSFDHHEISRDLYYRCAEIGERIVGLGRVIQPRYYYAHAALRWLAGALRREIADNKKVLTGHIDPADLSVPEVKKVKLGRRGTKSNPFVVGESVKLKGHGDVGTVVSVHSGEQGDAYRGGRCYAPMEYRVEFKVGTAQALSARYLEAVKQDE